MIPDKYITKIIAGVTVLAVSLCLLAVVFSDTLSQYLGGGAVSVEYETALFDREDVITIEISMEEEAWEEMLSQAMRETYYECDVTVNGTTFYSVGIRPKGNTSLSAIAMEEDNDRYSFKLEFDQYVEGQTCWGLDKLILNNNYADASNMKEALVYDMYGYLGADASLWNYARISVNGEYWGVYLALEAVEESFLLRNYGVEDGALYKPEGMGMGGGMEGGPGGEMKMDRVPGNRPDGEDMPGEAPGMEPDGGQGMPGFQRETGGADLNYTDDRLDSYAVIWEGEITDTSDADHRRVVTALKNIHEGSHLETYLDVDNILKYMAVHSFVVNEDSLSGSMAHNYYLYEYGGRLNILPWDYNLAFGGMSMGEAASASDVINDSIDTPFSGTQFFDALLENEEYLKRYHAYYRQLVEEYVSGGRFEETYSRIRSQIDDLVATDPNAMYSREEYEKAADMLYRTIELRGESVLGQLDGRIPSTREGQSADGSALVDASTVDLSVMGEFSMGGVGKPQGDNGFQEGGKPQGGTGFREGGGRPQGDVGVPEDGKFPGGMDDTPPDGFLYREGATPGNTVWVAVALEYGGCFLLLLLAVCFIKRYRRW